MRAACGVLHGFQPVSDLSFEYLRGGTGEPFAVAELESEADEPEGDLVVEWTPIPNRRIWASSTRTGRATGSGSKATGPRGRSAGSERRAAERSGGLGAARGAALGRADDALLPRPRRRAAACGRGRRRREGPACAPGYYGKTTLAAGSTPPATASSPRTSPASGSRQAAVVPGPALLRVRRDVAESFDLPGARAVAESDNRVHFSLDPAPR